MASYYISLPVVSGGEGGSGAIADGGTNNTTFTPGSVIFYDGTKLTDDGAGLAYDNTSNTLTVDVLKPTNYKSASGATGLTEIIIPTSGSIFYFQNGLLVEYSPTGGDA